MSARAPADGSLSGIDDQVTNANDRTFGYDAWGATSSATAGTSTLTYGLDAFERTVSRTQGSTATSFTYQGASETLVRSTPSTGSSTTFSHTPGGPLAAKTGTATPVEHLRDLHGDVVGTFAAAAGTTSMTDETWYSPFGEPAALAGGLPLLGFQGQMTDPSTGTVDMTTRQYLPSLGRFTTRDVLGGDPADPPSLNQWVYATGNPITFTDPTGMSSTPGAIREAPSSTAPASTIGALEEEQCDYTCEFWALAERPDLAPIFGLAATELPERLGLLAERVLDNILSSYCPDGRPSRENPTSACGPLSAEARDAVQQVRDAATVQDLVCRAGPLCVLIDGSGLVATGVVLGLDAIIHDMPATACAFAPVMSYIPGDYPLVVFGAKTVFGRVALSWLKQAGKVLTSGPGEVALNVRKGLVWVSGVSTAIHAGCRVAGAYG